MNQMALIEPPKPIPVSDQQVPPGHYRDRIGMRELFQPIIPGVVDGVLKALKAGPLGRRELHVMACPYLDAHTLGKHLTMLIQQGFIIEKHQFNRQLWEEPVLYWLADGEAA